LQARLEATKVEFLTGHNPNGWLLALPANIRLGWEGMGVANTLTYYDSTTIMAVKSFTAQAPASHFSSCQAGAG